jgi:hypothetical protein
LSQERYPGQLNVPLHLYLFDPLKLVMMVNQMILAEIFWRALGCGSKDKTLWDVVYTFCERIVPAIKVGGAVGLAWWHFYGPSWWMATPIIIAGATAQLAHVELLMRWGMYLTAEDLSLLEEGEIIEDEFPQ